MPMRCLLVPTGPDTDPRPRLDLALRLSDRLKAHIALTILCPSAEDVLASIPEVAIAAGVTRERLEQETREAIEAARIAFDAWCAGADVVNRPADDICPGLEDASFTVRLGPIDASLARAGRLSDLILVDRPDWSDPFAAVAFDTAVFATGRPTLVVPPAPPPADPLRKVLIAWNDSLEGARAVAQAMPLLQAAGAVAIFCAPRRDETRSAASDLAAYLARHGIAAEVLAAPDPSRAVGAALLETASAVGANLIVMGAYTHSRVRQFFLGGVTRHVLDHADVPVLMAH
ncbi:universal stress protein [Methylobacterium nodulans]|uniref:UspA domain protein n=1 Tax=Methylobacterium nodulans (strain LMG 21967 / CNCM I-2342 / ORS 2060) TaxID=460265 RepID=B8IKU8_METNO|nr:universal stress protein [Methylobacterium nodulans]ACL56305.1 UspA domain protein [Methylobacterium nodulans ORS 2060]